MIVNVSPEKKNRSFFFALGVLALWFLLWFWVFRVLGRRCADFLLVTVKFLHFFFFSNPVLVVLFSFCTMA